MLDVQGEEDTPSRTHPTIYHVRLHGRLALAWEICSEGAKAAYTQEWREKAARRGKKTIEVWSRYGKLGEYPVEVPNGQPG